MGIISWISVGLIAGWVAGKVLKVGGFGTLNDILIGMAGGLLGGWIASAFLQVGAGVSGITYETILAAFLGGLGMLILLRLLTGRRLRFHL